MSREVLLRKVIYKSLHRGCKENDVLVGQFAASQLQDFSDEELLIYADFLEEDDYQIYHWILKNEITPDKYLDIITKIRKFHSL
jgi:antitoxin CptB